MADSNWLFVAGVSGNDNEFDLIAADEANRAAVPAKHTATSRTTQASHAPVSTEEADEYDDSRIASLKEMGFTAEEARNALAQCNDDVNEALTLLLGSR